FPEVNTIVAEDHRRAGDAVFLHDARHGGGLEPGFEVLNELLVRIALDGLEVRPATELANELFGRKATELVLGDRERDHRRDIGGETGGGVFLEERYVGVAVE